MDEEELFGSPQTGMTLKEARVLVQEGVGRSRQEGYPPLEVEETLSYFKDLPFFKPGVVVGTPPRDWVVNVTTTHGCMRWTDTQGKEREGDECFCVDCVRSKRPDLSVGDPAPTLGRDVEALKQMGIVGLYQPPPPHVEPCPVCGVIIESYEMKDEDSEVVHVECLSREVRNTLQAVGYSMSYLVRKKEEREDELKDRGMADEERDHVEFEEGGGGGGEPIQGPGQEEGDLVDKGGRGPCERPESSGLDLSVDEAVQSSSVKPGEGVSPTNK